MILSLAFQRGKIFPLLALQPCNFGVSHSSTMCSTFILSQVNQQNARGWVSEDEVAFYFQPIGARELVFT